MALSDLAVFTEFAYNTATLAVTQQVALFNEASAGAITLVSADHIGDFADEAFWAQLNGTVRRRNPYGSGDIPQISLSMLTDTMVKIAAGTPTIRMDPGQFNWIKQNPEIAGVKIGQKLAVDMVNDMFNVAVLALLTSLSQVNGLIVDRAANAGGTANDRRAAYPMFNDAQAKFGDGYNRLSAWLMHSTPMFQLFGTQFQNSNQLFKFGDLGIVQDQFGRRIIVNDVPGLKIAGASGQPNKFITLGLTPGAARIEQQSDFTDNTDTTNGKENIVRTYQAEWSYMCGVKGFSWAKIAGGKAPTDAAIGTTASWVRIAGLQDRDLPGVLIKTTDEAAV